MTHLWLELDAYESNLQWLRYAQKVSFETEAYPGETFNGQISFIHPVLNAKTRTVKIRVNVNNKNGRLKPQMFVRARIQTFINQQGLVIDNSLKGKLLCPMHPEIIDTVQKPCSICGMKLVPSEKLGLVSSNKGQAPLLIPVSAPLITGKRAVVYVRVKEGLFEGRLITLGPRVEGYYIVNKGLKEGDLVVTNGAFKIDSSLQILAKPSMMSSSKEEINKFTLPVESLQKLQPLFDAYFAIGTRLSKNSSSEIKTQSGKLMTALTLVDFNDSKNELLLAWQDMSRKIELKAKLLGNSKELEETRLNFEKLSKIMTLLVKQFGSPQTVHQAYCPMAFDDAGAFWLQTDKKITN
ncbi:MAG: DUF3347 domain-containing protein, partial [Lentisphaeraceae bacterium]|nr:DUF3347 domain-containing protein [Lentisphaeraceae bacterium]